MAHHQHLFSPASLGDPTPPPLPPEVTLPPEFSRVLVDRLEVFGSSSPPDLFTPDARLFWNRWMVGRDAVHAYFVRQDKLPGRRIAPHAFAMGATNGYIAGIHVREEAGAVERRQNFLMALQKGADGKWRIASEMLTAITPPTYTAPITAADLIENMDDAGIGRGVVLSLGYSFARSAAETPTEEEAVRAENDWTSAQVAQFPDRLVAFCSVNPLRSYALRELDRCIKLPHVKGVKLHLGSNRIDMGDPAHVSRLRTFFSALNERRMPVVVHMTMNSLNGREHARVFLDQLVPAAPDIVIQLAHLGANGRFDPKLTEPVLEVFAEAVAAGDPRMKNLYFDTTGMLDEAMGAEVTDMAARSLRRIGLQRVLFGSDMTPEPPPLVAWSMFRRKMPLTPEELQITAGNVAPYLR